MRILVVHPGADWSTADVHHGVVQELERQGVELVHYALSGRLQNSATWLDWCWKNAGKKHAKPTDADVLYHASLGALERALRFEVDWVLMISAMYFHPDLVVMLKRAGFKVAILFTESPYDDESQLRLAQFADVCWVNERSSVSDFASVCSHTHYWQHAIDPTRHRPTGQDAPDIPAHDVVFVGTGFPERIEVLEAVCWDGIDLGLYGTWSLLKEDSPLKPYLGGGLVANETAAAMYRKAKIGLNLHRQSRGYARISERIAHAESMNPRCYELAACGVFFVTDYREEVDEVFHGLAPTFETPTELEALIRHYLVAEDEREQIARQLPDFVRQHTFAHRVERMLAILRESSRA